MSEVKFKIFCDNVECKDCGKEVNEITFEDISEEDAICLLLQGKFCYSS